jgi:hypothetical protein
MVQMTRRQLSLHDTVVSQCASQMTMIGVFAMCRRVVVTMQGEV